MARLLQRNAGLVALGDVEEGAAVGAEQPLVGREHHEVGIERTDIERQHAGALRGIDEQGGARARSAGATRARSIAPPSDQCTEENEATAMGAAPARSIAVSRASVQSPLPGRRTVSTEKPPARERDIHSRTGEEWSSSRTSTREPAGTRSTLAAVATP